MSLLHELGMFDFKKEGRHSYLINSAERNFKMFLALDIYNSGKSALFVCSDELEAKNVSVKLGKYVGEDAVYYPREGLYFSYLDSFSGESSKDRLKVINKALRGERMIVVLSIFALSEMRAFFGEEDILNISVGDEVDTDHLAQRLINYGYTREARTEESGQFTLRGGIIDIFSPHMNEPVRIEFFGDEVDSIRTFDPTTQLSTGNVDDVFILPFTDSVMTEEEANEAFLNYDKDAEKLISKLKGEDKEKAREEYNFLREKLTHSSVNQNRLLYMYSPKKLLSIMELMADSPVIFSEPSLERAYKDMHRSVMADFTLQKSAFLAYTKQAEIFYSFEEIVSMCKERDFYVVTITDESIKYCQFDTVYRANCINVISYKGNMSALMKQVPMYLSDGYKVIFTYTQDNEYMTLVGFLENFGIRPAKIAPGNVSLAKEEIYSGIDSIEKKVLIIPAGEFLGGELPKPKKKKKAETQTFFSDVVPGDYIVHEKHGIGRYEGIERMNTAGVMRDYFKITYAKDDVLYVPAENMDRVQKYIGSSDAPPRLNRLGSNDWANTKTKVSKAVKELAKEYVVMYANRRNMKGFAFSEDSDWQSEFEAKFPYEPTNDQLKAVSEIKSDMERPSPMDRLLCGDVGFGKTEVAIRAAFKAVLDSKQVAVLAPTTILALQHYNNFTERFKDYPVKIEMMSRFRTSKQLKQTAENLKRGITEIVIGTHRILSKDVEFKDLGLLIIDEEQRFGVAHKDKLKLMKQDVDTLSLSATPIPRTLHMSLSGIRDISTIEEAPAERLPVLTYVMEYDESVIKQALTTELERGGQVFFLHNKVKDIEECALRVSELVPEGRVVFAHGQMEEKELERIIVSFLNKEFDILVSTSIIEIGIDIMNANTMIIEDADKLGLSQLYQLRGRVGRGSRQGYCYMLYAKDKQISEIAQKRLGAMKEFTKFGSGFKIAMRDLQIRGAGNLLGANQHGHFANVGYEMYCRMLQEAVADELGEEANVVRPIETEIDLVVNAFIPQDYIEGELDRIEVYKRIAAITSEEDFDDVADNITDRFSDIPDSVENLLRIALLKALASKAGISKIRESEEMYFIEYEDASKFDPNILSLLADKKYIVKLRKNSKYPIFAVVKNKQKNNIRFCMELVKNIIPKE